MTAMGVALALVACGGDGPSDPGNGGNGDPPPPPATGTVSGSIEDDLGSPLASIGVALRESGSATNSETTTSSAAGQFSFDDVEVGAWDVVVTVPATHALDGQPNPVSVSVVENQTATAAFELRLRAGTVAGVVLTDVGDPVRDVTIVLSESGSATPVAGATTSATGAYAMDRIPVGSYDVTVEAPAATMVVGSDEVAADVADLATATADFEFELLPVSLATHVQPVFTNNCTACHVGAGAPAGLELTAGDSYGHTVGIAAVQLPAMDLISPGDPDGSYLVHKIQGTHIGVGGAASRMPLGAAPLRDQVIDLIRRWAEEGAADN